MSRKTVKMLVDMRGSEDGHTIKMFKKDETYDMEASLADTFISEDWAKAVGKAAKKAVKNTLDNKMLDGAPDDKAEIGNYHDDPDDEDEYFEPDTGQDGGEVDEAQDVPEDYPPLSYAKHTSFGRWYVYSKDGEKLSGPHTKQEVMGMGFEA
jgi:hypothetical protein